jgi:glycosyltransferase XagB
MMRDSYQLHIKSSDNDITTLSLDGEALLIGRSGSRCDVVLEDRRASRVHVKLQQKHGYGWTVTDMHSANGTLLGNRKLKPAEPMLWKPEQMLVIGGTQLLIERTAVAAYAGTIQDITMPREVVAETSAPVALETTIWDDIPAGDETQHTLLRYAENGESLNYALVIVPTYNEAANIDRLIDLILMQGRQFDVLVVDDNSPDGTGELVAERAQSNERIKVLRREGKLGLGSAYIAGFQYAIENGYSYAVQMDADFSHQPRFLPALLHLTENLCDVAIGSRKIPGGSTENWSQVREIISRGGSLYTQMMLGLPIQDVTSGYKCFRVEVLETIDLDSIQTNGFGFQVEVNYRAYRAGFHLSEYPIMFPDRVAGQSKMSMMIFVEAMLKVLGMRLNSLMGAYRLVMAQGSRRVEAERHPRASYVDAAKMKSRGKVFPAFDDFVMTHTLTSRLAPFVILLGALALVAWLIYTRARGDWTLTADGLLTGAVVLLSLFLSLQSLFTLVWMLYSWNNPEAAQHNRSPRKYAKPAVSFTALVPARHEADVIADTILAVSRIDYPEHLKETLILCRRDDTETIAAAERTIAAMGRPNVRLVVFGGQPINKPAALNKGLKYATNEVVCVFDAEDEPHSDLYNVVNTVMLRDHADVVQSGVQLMNYRSKWFSALNVLEYFFWFKSGLLFFSRVWQVTPLGGNTVFVKRNYLRRIGGWDEDILTEDADLGIRLTAAGARLRVIYDEIHATREETPVSVGSFIKQRTRWNQGFMQVLGKGSWLTLPRLRQKLFVLYILLTPIIQSLLLVALPFSLLVALTTKIPVGWAVVTFMPLGLLLIQFVVHVLGLFDFARAYNLRLPFWYPLALGISYYPYQLLLSVAAFRAVFRTLFGRSNWEKTAHVNAHRNLSVEEAGA